MIRNLRSPRKRLMFRGTAIVVLFVFILSATGGGAYAQDLMWMPPPGIRVSTSPEFNPPLLKGITINPQNPLQFDFLIDQGDKSVPQNEKEDTYRKLVKYFLASLTLPEKDLWVNLSPYEKDRIIEDNFGKTEMGRDLLSQDYVLKQLTASIIYPEEQLGKAFWDKVYKLAYEKYGSTDIPVNTFNKVWIVPDEATVYESGNTAMVLKSHLKVMLEEDYLSLQHNQANENLGTNQVAENDVKKVSNVSSQVIREIVLPEIEKEVNTGKNFALLRQIYSAMILATWYKKSLKESLLGQVYIDKGKVMGVDLQDKDANQKIYEQYLKAFKKGAYNYIKEDYDKYTQETVPRKYFSGGFKAGAERITDPQTGKVQLVGLSPETLVVVNPATIASSDSALERTYEAKVASGETKTDLARIKLNESEAEVATQEKITQGKGKDFAMLGVQSQENINDQIAKTTPQRHGFIKDAPIMGYQIVSDKFEDIPEQIRRHIGAVDQTKYTPEYLKANIGSIIALQMNGDQPDFYIVGKDTFDAKYRAIDVTEVSKKNAKVFGKLTTVEGIKELIDGQGANLIGALKTVPVEMIKMSEAGYLVSEEIKIQSPWGEQTKPAGKDAYLVFDASKNQYYMVNSDANGNPISYVSSDQLKEESPDAAMLGAQISNSDLERLAKVSKQIREKTTNTVPSDFKQVNLDTSSREDYLNSTARYFEQQFGFPAGSLTVSFPAVAPLSGNEVLFLNKDGKSIAVVKIFLRSEQDVPFGGEAIREIESSVLLRNRNIQVPEIYDVVSVNNLDANNQQRPLMIVSALAKGGDVASRLRALIKADAGNDRNSIKAIIEESRSVGEALAKFHDSFPAPAGLNSINNDYDYHRMKRSIEELDKKGDVNQEEKDKLNSLVDGLFELMGKSGLRPVAVHGDFHGGNVFIQDGKVSDFIDTETIFWSLDSEYKGIGNPANDLARFLDNLHDRLVDSTVSTYIINQLEEAFLEGYSKTRNINKETLMDAIEFYKARTALVALQYSPSEYAKENAKRRLRAYLNGKSIAELTENLASNLHEGWRSPRKLSSSDSRVAQGVLFEPRPKPLDPIVDKEWLGNNKTVPVYDISRLRLEDLPATWSEKEKANAMRETGKIVIDIANTSYKELPPSWQAENRNAAESATRLIGRRLAEGQQVTLEDKEWIEEASGVIHREWLKRPANSWALNDPSLNKEYKALSEEQKSKNRDIIVQGIELYNPLNFVTASSIDAAMLGIQSQVIITDRIDQAKPQRHNFIKDAPILGYRISSDSFDALPAVIRDQLGVIDRTKYTPEYLRQNIGSIIALQMNGDKPDFYVVGKATFDQKYKVVEMSEVSKKNVKVFGKLTAIPEVKALTDSNDPNLVGALKTVPVEMIKMSEVGYAVAEEVKIQSPWGEQTKPAGQDAYLTFDSSQNMYYMVNSDATGNPISYVSSGQLKEKSPDAAMLGTQTQDIMTERITRATPQRYGFIKDAPILGYQITSDKFEDIPAAIRDQIGAVDQTKYTPEYLRANMGSMIALQMNGDQPDFYIVGKDTFDQKYKVVGVEQVSQKNAKVFNKLMGISGLKAVADEKNANLIGALKTVPVEMIKMSEVGYPIEEDVTIQSPWGEQTKPAGKDAYLVFDSSKNQYYMVNSDDSGNPISYVAVEKKGPDSAMLTQEQVVAKPQTDFTKGGIDFNSANLNLQIKRDGKGVPLPINMQNIQNINVEGFIPVIFEITPVTNLPLLLGSADNNPAFSSQLSMSQ